MGILNITPDSFYDKSRQSCLDDAITTACRMKEEGADILDIGGESTRPGANDVSEDEELNRVIPVIKGIKEKIDIPISIDTKKSAVAREAIKAGATIINDVTGFDDPEMVALAAENDLDICVMHMLGTPKTMQVNPHYEFGIISHLLQWFDEKVNVLIRAGVKSERIILDPGIGFGKTVDDNLKIIHNLSSLKQLGFRMLLGVSRKSFLSKILGKPTGELLNATVAVNAFAVASNVDIIRVHDVKEHREVADIFMNFNKIYKE